jgi:two-component system, NarL family, response regulator LiaR
MMSAALAPEHCPTSGAPRPSNTYPVPISGTWPPGGRATVRVLIASHQPIVRHGLHGLLAAEAEIEIVGESGDGSEALRLARRFRPDLVLIDMGIQTLDAIVVTRTIRSELRDTQVIVISGGNDDASAVASLRAGATAYLRREARTEDLLRAIRSAVAGQVVLPAQAVARLLHSMGRHQALSERETEVLYLVARGLANKQVARDLGIAESTVKCHVSGILTKLGLPSRTQVALYAARTGLLALECPGTESAEDTLDAWRTA